MKKRNKCLVIILTVLSLKILSVSERLISAHHLRRL